MNLNKKYIKSNGKIIGFVVLVLVILLLFFILRGKDINKNNILLENEQEEKLPESNIPTEPNTGGLSLRDLRDNGDSKYCSFTQESQGTNIVGEIYMNKGVIFLLSQLAIPGAQTNLQNFLISDGEFSYSWLSGQKEGVKFSAKTSDPELANDGYYINGEADFGLSQITDAICSDWEVDFSMFDLPKDVVFEEIEFDIISNQ